MSSGNKFYFLLFGIMPSSILFGIWQDNYFAFLWLFSIYVSIGTLIDIIIQEIKRKEYV